jgi:prepilin-type N-terminal cleavage/methylation domain-containing protein
MKRFTPISQNASRGFTLVETLVAITILMIALTVPFYSLQQAIVASNAARDQLVASSLAEEGAEYIYYLRDSNYLANASWLTGMDACLSGGAPYGCMADPSQNTLTSCVSTGCNPLKLSASNLYTYAGSGPTTRFTRTVKIEQVTATEAKVTVTVTWVSGHRNYSVIVTDTLYNWL